MEMQMLYNSTSKGSIAVNREKANSVVEQKYLQKAIYLDANLKPISLYKPIELRRKAAMTLRFKKELDQKKD
jgi:hypothetical protein